MSMRHILTIVNTNDPLTLAVEYTPRRTGAGSGRAGGFGHFGASGSSFPGSQHRATRRRGASGDRVGEVALAGGLPGQRQASYHCDRRCAIRLPRPLDAVETRVLGCLLEKQQATPEYYPLTVNALVAACNQKSNREPVMEVTEGDVRGALDRLRAEVLVWPVESVRAERWEHNLDRSWELEPAGKALMTVLLLRGPQTPGELRGRCERMHPFGELAEVGAALDRLTDGAEPLVTELPREPGQKERRWAHLVAAPPPKSAERAALTVPAAASGLADRVAALEDRVSELVAQLDRLVATLGRKE